MDMLAERRPHSTLMVEGGSRIISSFLYSGYVDNLIVTVAPIIVGDEGVPVVQSGSSGSKPVSKAKGSVPLEPVQDVI